MNYIILILGLISFAAPRVKVENAWMRIANKGMNTALYLDVTNLSSKDDELTDVSSNISNTVQIMKLISRG